MKPYDPFGIGGMTEKKIYSCHYLSSSFRSFTDGVKLFSSGDHGNIEDAITLLFKGWERLWQASRVSTENGHLIKAKGRIYSLSDFLGEISNSTVNIKDVGKLPYLKSCSLDCVPCSVCPAGCVSHPIQEICSCFECENSITSTCNSCGSYLTICERCILCRYPKDISMNSGGHPPSSIKYMGTNPKLLHGDFQTLEQDSPFRASLILLKDLRNQDQHQYIESYTSSNLRISYLLYPYILATIFNYIAIYNLVKKSVTIACKNRCISGKCAAGDLSISDTDRLMSAFSVPMNLFDPRFESESSVLNNFSKQSQKNTYSYHVKNSLNKIQNKYKNDPNLDKLKAILKVEGTELNSQGSVPMKKIIGKIFQLGPQDKDFKFAEQAIDDFLLEIKSEKQVFYKTSDVDAMVERKSEIIKNMLSLKKDDAEAPW